MRPQSWRIDPLRASFSHENKLAITMQNYMISSTLLIAALVMSPLSPARASGLSEKDVLEICQRYVASHCVRFHDQRLLKQCRQLRARECVARYK